MRYTVIVSKKVLKSIEKIPENYKSKIKKFIFSLSETFNPPGYDTKKMTGVYNIYRCRIGIYRVVYERMDNKLVIEVIDIDQRKDVYK